MGDIYSPVVAHDENIACGRGMTNCEICGISGWCGMECPALIKGDCGDEEMLSEYEKENTTNGMK